MAGTGVCSITCTYIHSMGVLFLNKATAWIMCAFNIYMLLDIVCAIPDLNLF